MKKQILRIAGAVIVAAAPMGALAQTPGPANTAPATQPAQAVPATQPIVFGAQSPNNQGPPLTKATRDVLQMSAAGVQEGVLKAFVQTSPHTFNLTADAIIYLQSHSIPPALITDMMARDTELHNEGMIAAKTLQQQPDQNGNVPVPQPYPYVQQGQQQIIPTYQTVAPSPYDYGYNTSPYDYGYDSYPYYPYGGYFYPGFYGPIVVGRIGFGHHFGGHPGVGFHGGVGGGIHVGIGGVGGVHGAVGGHAGGGGHR